MIKVTVWNENIQERGAAGYADYVTVREESRAGMDSGAAEIRKVHPDGIHNTIRAILEEDADFAVRTVTMEMPECGLTEEVLNDTDVLIWWAHVGHNYVPDEIALRVRDHVLRGMGFIALHSAHPSKPMQFLLGTSGSLQWRDGDRSRLWCTCPTHPIAEGIPASVELPAEEMYGEFFDIPKPDDLVFISWFSGGEVFRSGCTWTRGYGKIFYFQPGHETQPSYHVPEVRRIIRNAAHWANPTMRRPDLSCPHAKVSAEERR